MKINDKIKVIEKTINCRLSQPAWMPYISMSLKHFLLNNSYIILRVFLHYVYFIRINDNMGTYGAVKWRLALENV